LQILADANGLQGVAWQSITPNEKHDWINQRGDVFDTFISLGDKKDKNTETVFEDYSGGIKTNRDAWQYNFSKEKISGNMKRMLDFYGELVERFLTHKQHDDRVNFEEFINNDPTKISWSNKLRSDLKAGRVYSFEKKRVVQTMYRPFCKQWTYFDTQLLSDGLKLRHVFPEPEMENVVIGVLGRGATVNFSAFVTKMLPDLEAVSKAQWFPLYTYERVEQSRNQLIAESPQLVNCGSDGELIGDYIRRENISDAILRKFQEHYSPLTPSPSLLITKEDIFYYVYGILHSESYKTRFAADLKKQLPRIPMVDDFWTFSKAGRNLTALHLNYETGVMYPLEERDVGRGVRNEVNYRVEKMRFLKGEKVQTNPSPLVSQPSTIIYNEHLRLAGIPAAAYRYIVNGRSAIEWIMERYQVSTHKESGIVNDPNDWCREQGNERYIVDLIKRIVHLSVESVKIIEGLPVVEF
jgi:predicted helicase